MIFWCLRLFMIYVQQKLTVRVLDFLEKLGGIRVKTRSSTLVKIS